MANARQFMAARTAAWAKAGGGPTPPGVKIEYIQGSEQSFGGVARCFVKTDVRMSLNSEIEATLGGSDFDVAPWIYFFGVQSGDDSLDQFSFRRFDHRFNRCHFSIGNSSVEVPIPTGVPFSITANRNSVVINGESVVSVPSPRNDVYSGELYFLCSNWGGTPMRSSDFTVYGATVTDNGVVVGNFIPILLNGRATLWNSITDYVCPSNGIIAGPTL